MFPVPDGPINQHRIAPGNLMVHRYNILTTDGVCCAVWKPIASPVGSGFSSMTSFVEEEIPAGLQTLALHELGGFRYSWFGQIEGEEMDAAIEAAFPGYVSYQNIPGADHQSRAERFQRLDGDLRAAVLERGCPTCGIYRRDRSQCEPCAALWPTVPTEEARCAS